MNKLKNVTALSLILLLAFSSFGCSKDVQKIPDAMNRNDTDFELALASSSFDYENTFTSRDLSAEYDNKVYHIQLSDYNSTSDNNKVSITDNMITITNTGTYIIKGKLTDGLIVVDADDTDKIQLVLDGAEINNSSTSAIKIVEAKKVFITLADNSKNILSSPNEFVKTENDKADGVVYSKRKLTLNGSGLLSITSPYGHGIVCNDDLIIADGNYNIDAGKHALKAEDSVYFAGGKMSINCKKDAVHCSHDTNADKGNIYIKNTSLEINAEDDAIQASGFIIIDDGSIRILNSDEGIEAQKIEINGGNINLKAKDDGINASSGKSSVNTDNLSEPQNNFGKSNPFDGDENCYINITGGNITIDADGDGIDSNGYLQQCGGDVIVYGPENDGNAALDYSISAKITGGTLAAFGYSGMAQGFNSYSTQGSILINFDSDTNDKFVLTDNKNNEIFSAKANKKYNSVVVSSSNITVGNTYIAAAGNQSKTIKLDEISYIDKSVQTNGRGFNGVRKEKGNKPSENPPSDMPDMSNNDRRGGMSEPPSDMKGTDFN